MDHIIELERRALDRWGNGDPGGFLDLYGSDVTYFDPLTAVRIDGHQAMADYCRPWVARIQIPREQLSARACPQPERSARHEHDDLPELHR